MSLQETTGFLGLELTSESWLRNHFRAKLPERLQQILRLPIHRGDRVLDLCCGPGHYTEYYAQMVGSSGMVHGVDKDPALIDAAEARQAHLLLGDNIRYSCCDVAQPDSITLIQEQQYDVLLFFNCLSYFVDPGSTIRKYSSFLRRGGRIILKDSDFGHLLISPLDQTLLHRVIEAAEASPQLSFDNFFGRRLLSLASSLDIGRTRVEIWSYPMTSPLTPEQEFYVSENLMTLMAQGKRALKRKDIDLWTSMFSYDSPERLLLRKDFLFLMHEIVTITTL